MSVAHLSPLRYPGGKTKFTDLITAILQTNHLIGHAYVEPYAGGAGAALCLLKKGVVSEIHINDKDPITLTEPIEWLGWHDAQENQNTDTKNNTTISFPSSPTSSLATRYGTPPHRKPGHKTSNSSPTALSHNTTQTASPNGFTQGPTPPKPPPPPKKHQHLT